jgi:hypothetical protein
MEDIMKSTVMLEVKAISQLVSIENFIPVLEAQQQAVDASETELKRMIDEYQKYRFNLFKAHLKQKGRGWCTIDRHFVPASGLQFLLKTGKRWRSSHESDYLRDYAEIHRACASCRRKALEMSGSGDGKAIGYAYPAKKNGKRFLYEKHGAWHPLPAEAQSQEMPDYILTKTLAVELGLPKEITYSSVPFKVKIED